MRWEPSPIPSGRRAGMMRKGIRGIFILLVVLLVSGHAWGEEEDTMWIMHQRLDTGVTFLWKNSQGEWQQNLYPGGSLSLSTLFYIGKDYVDVEVVPYHHQANPGEPGYFDFSGETSYWNQTALAWDKISYDYHYDQFSGIIQGNTCQTAYNSQEGSLLFTATMTLLPREGVWYNIKEQLMLGQEGKDYLLALLDNPTSDIIEKMNLLDPREETYNPNVEGYLLFHPVVITYWEEVPLPEEGPLEEEEPIPEERDLSFTPSLEIPEVTYLGHPTPAIDRTSFYLEGLPVTATQVYGEGLASNGFGVLSGPGGSTQGVSIRRNSSTRGEYTFSRVGLYQTQLEVEDQWGRRGQDIQPVEVRPTPYILDTLGGTQKQNRKQVLLLSVAVSPGYPIRDFEISIWDPETEEQVTLTSRQPACTTASSIKTRAVTSSGGVTWETYQLEFLTKTPMYDPTKPDQTREFSYSATMEDSKGDSHQCTGSFSVVPDLPPEPSLWIPTTHVREEGTNQAFLIMEDESTTDGDQLDRTWFLDGREMGEGLQDLSFGSGQKVGCHKEGVGYARVGLRVRDRWVEPTLPEFIDEEMDIHQGFVEKTTEVVNIPPVVSFEPRSMEKVHFLLTVPREDLSLFRMVENQWALRMVEEGIDTTFQWIPLPPSHHNGYTFQGYREWPVSINCFCCQSTGMVMDSQHVYRVEGSGRVLSGYQEVCLPPHTLYAMAPAAEGQQLSTVWSYTLPESQRFRIQIDGGENYVFLLMQDLGETWLLHQKTGAEIARLPHLLPNTTPYLSSDGTRLYFMDNGLVRYDLSTQTMTRLSQENTYLTDLREGKITYLVKESPCGFSYHLFDMEGETWEARDLPKLEVPYTGKNLTEIIPTDMDRTGKITFVQKGVDGYGDTTLYFYWLVDGNTGKVSQVQGNAWDLRNLSVGLVKDDEERATHVYWEMGDDDSTSATTRRYHYLSLYEITSEGAIGPGRTIYSARDNKQNWSGIKYARYHQEEEAIYLMQGADFGWNGLIPGMTFRIQLPGWQVSSSPYDWHWDVAEEGALRAGERMITYYRQDAWTGMTHRVKLFTVSLSEEGAESWANGRYAKEDPTKRNISLAPASPEQWIPLTLEALEETNPKKVLILEGPGSPFVEKPFEADYEETLQFTTSLEAPEGRPPEWTITWEEILPEGGTLLYEKEGHQADFTMPAWDPFFTVGSSYYLHLGYGHSGIGSGWYGKKAENKNYSCFLELTMEEPGYLTYDFFRWYGYDMGGTWSTRLNGVPIESGSTMAGGTRLLFLEEGSHRLDFYGYGSGVIGYSRAKVGYLKEERKREVQTSWREKEGVWTGNLLLQTGYRPLLYSSTENLPPHNLLYTGWADPNLSWQSLPDQDQTGTFRLQIEGEGLSSDTAIKIWEVEGKTREQIPKTRGPFPTDSLEGWQVPSLYEEQVRVGEIQPWEEEPLPPLIYNKGDLVAFHIHYQDYEEDPSKRSYWRYRHTPYNDGLHPLHQQVLDQPIPRFYIDGKYEVDHWQEDDTSRGLIPGGNPAYDALSNVETIPFYIQGGGTAPWITHLYTTPGHPEAGDPFRVHVGVDDGEKDPLNIEVEVYHQRKLVYRESWHYILPNAAGVYPLQTTAQLPPAEVGTYQVVAGVYDDHGRGMDTLVFQVEEPRGIEGSLFHEEPWQQRRLARDPPLAHSLFHIKEPIGLEAGVEGSPLWVRGEILGYGHWLECTTFLLPAGEGRYLGRLPPEYVQEEWLSQLPLPLTIRFTAGYEEGQEEFHDVPFSLEELWPTLRIHRLF